MGSKACSARDDDTGLRCAREASHEGSHYVVVEWPEDDWQPLPDEARYDRREDQWCVQDEPVVVNLAATMYIREPDGDGTQ